MKFPPVTNHILSMFGLDRKRLAMCNKGIDLGLGIKFMVRLLCMQWPVKTTVTDST